MCDNAIFDKPKFDMPASHIAYRKIAHPGIPPYLIVICGPTAVGKTAVSIEVAKHFSAEIISADSRQFYEEMNIGTAKPSPNQLRQVKHHFINNISIHVKNYNAGKYEYEALEFLEKYFKKHRVAVMVGGSGLFIHAVSSGFDPMGNIQSEEKNVARKFLNEQNLAWLQQEVERLDPEYFAVVDRKNPVRLKRALEVIYTTGKKYSEQRIGNRAERPFQIIKIGLRLPTETLHERIDKRVNEMMKKGLLAEAQKLYLHRKLNALNTVGYQELFDYIEDKLSLPQAIELIKQNTRQYAKRQMTWFKRDEGINWFEPEQVKDILHYIDDKMKD